MATFAEVESEVPEFATRVRAAFDAHRHKVLATLRPDGAPRVSGIEMQFVGGEPWLAGMPGSTKFDDLRRDPRFALHSGSDEPDAWSGDAKLSGRAVEVTGSAERAAFARDAGVPMKPTDFELFRVDLGQVVFVALNEQRTGLVIASWRPGKGLTRTTR